MQPYNSTLTATASITNITCSQPTGAVTITASNGNSPYQYSLNNGNFVSTNSFQTLPLGNQKVTVKDAGGCLYEVNFTISQVASTLNATAIITNAKCGLANGAVTIQASGGASGYTFGLDNGSFQTSNTFNNLGATNHTVVVKDQAGCLFSLPFTVNNTGNPPNLVITNPTKICPGSTANLQATTVTNGSDTGLVYTYWQDTVATTSLTNPATVANGTYYIKGENKDGCTTIKPVIVPLHGITAGTITPAGPVQICNGSFATLTGSAGKTYQWYRNDTAILGA
ncbi:MAG: hypothetical protein EON98_16305, partial [Chitinophagaceae bacterium]